MELNLKNNNFNIWLNAARNENKTYKYRHLKLAENTTHRSSIIPDLQQLIEKAHEDYKMSKRKAFEDVLDPTVDISAMVEKDPAYGYPDKLDLNTLKGYFGEIFSGIIAENFTPFNLGNWEVPTFNFRFHESAFNQLETLKQTGEMKKATIGRHGDDCIAFILDDNDNISNILFCEAKCSSNHDSSMINEAHKQISDNNFLPVELQRINEILADYNTDYAKKWRKAITQLYFSDDYKDKRYDLVSYVHGQSPKRNNTWIDVDKPHKNYTAGRNLESVEVHIPEVEDLIIELYR